MDTMIKKQLTGVSLKYGWLLLQLLLLCLTACTTQSDNYAPVTNGWQQSAAGSTYHVLKGETLYSIAWRFGLDYRDLAAANNIAPPYHVKSGQVINLVANSDQGNAEAASNSSSTTVQTYGLGTNNQSFTANSTASTNSSSVSVSSSTPVPPAMQPTADNNPVNTDNGQANQNNVATTTTGINQTVKTAAVASVPTAMTPPVTDYTNGPVTHWVWPVHGRIIDNFNGSSGYNKGIDIAGQMGQPIHATASGKIVYCGSGLRGYGQLIIIKHNDEYLSAYAHNNKLLVHEGQIVKTGQVIALMGNSEAQQVMLHFEIRRAGKPVDPLTYLNK